MTPAPQAPIILSFDVEEHHRIEAAAGLTCSPDLRAEYGRRMDCCTRWLLDELAGLDIRATFFVVGQVAKTHPDLVRAMHQAGHEVGSHSWDHRRVHRLAPDEFREDVRRSKEVIEDLTGEAVAGYRAPTFSVTRETAWAIDVLAELGLRYDSSIYPVRHDRYGIRRAARPLSREGPRADPPGDPAGDATTVRRERPSGGRRLLPAAAAVPDGAGVRAGAAPL